MRGLRLSGNIRPPATKLIVVLTEYHRTLYSLNRTRYRAALFIVLSHTICSYLAYDKIGPYAYRPHS